MCTLRLTWEFAELTLTPLSTLINYAIFQIIQFKKRQNWLWAQINLMSTSKPMSLNSKTLLGRPLFFPRLNTLLNWLSDKWHLRLLKTDPTPLSYSDSILYLTASLIPGWLKWICPLPVQSDNLGWKTCSMICLMVLWIWSKPKSDNSVYLLSINSLKKTQRSITLKLVKKARVHWIKCSQKSTPDWEEKRLLTLSGNAFILKKYCARKVQGRSWSQRARQWLTSTSWTMYFNI